MNKSEVLINRAEKVIMPTYARFPIAFESGNGCVLKDVNGKEYLDCVAGIAVDCLGHNHPGLNAAIADQCQKIMHVSNLYWTEPQIDAAEMLVKASGLDKVFFCNSGAEANEAALKLVRIYAKQFKSEYAVEIIAMDHSFHGRTYGSITATGQEKYHKGLDPLLPGISHVPFNDFDALKAAVTDKTCAVLLEPIQGEGGIYPATKEFMEGVRKLCDEHDILLILDEIQCGMGRTGEMFAWQHYGVKPDIMTSAKALGCGVPVGAFLMTEKVAEKSLKPGDHGTTYGGNPFVGAAVDKVLEMMERDHITDHVKEITPYLEEKLDELVASYDFLTARRGLGLMQGVVSEKPVGQIAAKALEEGLIVITAGSDVLRFVPPLIIEKQHVDEMIGKLKKALDQM